MNAQEQQAVNSVASLAQTYISQTYQDANALETKAIGAVHDLPFSHNFPQFFEVAPQYVTDAGTDPIRLQILGDFIDLPKAGYDPTLVISPDTPTPGQQSLGDHYEHG